ncbi:nitroreductase family protein [Kribbella sp. VKM Ac-2571]|uniref:nitroreductase family protein n=1 Tax=Kribbella sp. VKM Ac-2571 TaxID=2512222 RepID=UPI00105F32E8
MWITPSDTSGRLVEVQQLSPDQIDVLLGAAVAAPSTHNTQPWRFEVQGDTVDVFLDRSRALPAEDSTGRACVSRPVPRSSISGARPRRWDSAVGIGSHHRTPSPI